MQKIGRVFFTAILLFGVSSLYSQDLTGIWRGYFITESGDQYKYEVQLDHSKKKTLSGVTYSYLDTRFYGKATFTGNFTRASSAAMVQEIKTVELRITGGSVACIMKCRLVYSRSGREEFLDGVYTSAYEKTDPAYGVKKGGDCGGGSVHLRKVPTSDFYVEPFLRSKKPATGIPKTETEKALGAKKAPAKTLPVSSGKKPAPKKDEIVRKPVNRPATVQPEITTPDVAITTKPVVPKIVSTPITIRDRKNELTRTITVNNKTVRISLYDNGEIDDDTVSIYLDGSLILANKRLSNKPITYLLTLDEESPEHTLTMVAENLGRIPPNTSLMIIEDGEKRYQVGITSTEQKNAMVRFRYNK